MYGGSLRVALVADDSCPECLGEIGAKFFCIKCKYNATPEVFAISMYQMEELLNFMKVPPELLEALQ